MSFGKSQMPCNVISLTETDNKTMESLQQVPTVRIAG